MRTGSLPWLLIDQPEDIAKAARALAGGAVIAAAFGNFYVICGDPSAETVRRINMAKGRPVDQVGSITTAAPRISAMFDWSRLSPRLDEQRMRALMSNLYAACGVPNPGYRV